MENEFLLSFSLLVIISSSLGADEEEKEQGREMNASLLENNRLADWAYICVYASTTHR